MSRRRWPLLVVAAVSVGLAARAAFLYWSPLPATLDGFRYARLAAGLDGSLLASAVQSDELVWTLLLGAAADVTGVRPLYLAQPLVACIGGASVLGGLVLVRGVGRAADWPARRTFHASVLAGLGLAVSGMYLRRTGVPDEEALALLLLPLFALAAHRALASNRRAWAGLFGLLALVYPPLHNMSSLVAAFTLTAVVVVHLAQAESRREVLAPTVAVAGFWSYFFGYYTAAERVGLELTYSGLLGDHLGAFFAWLVVLAVGTVWLYTTTDRAVRTTLGVGVGIWFLAAGANLVAPVFPGTIETPPLILGLALLYVVPVALFAWGLPSVRRLGGDAPATVALLLAPVALVWFTLATSLTPEFFGTAMRVQVHAHVATFVLAAVVAVAIAADRPVAGRTLVAVLVVATLLSAPFAFVHIDTATAPRTVHASEFDAVSVAASSGGYASDHRLSRVGPLYYGGNVSGAVGPTRAWLAGGDPPDCLTLAQRSWTVEGAHFYPTPPLRLPPDRFDRWHERGNLVYSTGGTTETYLVVPPGESETC
ncbi:sodium:phosphate symporter [Halorarius halobius]|uniref:sodium:phosphate symporter n=1 Tax=Halorarius halobius TaxID=2962671 RepID=UPI0020CC12F7|nr:sodium:phosphate symporter [Halorarius halobius]